MSGDAETRGFHPVDESMPDTITGRPVGARVEAWSPSLPNAIKIRGRDITIVSLDPEIHGPALYAVTHGLDRHDLWLYLFVGPFAGEDEFLAYLRTRASAKGQHDVVILDNRSELPVGFACYLNIEPEHRRIEVGSIVYTSTLQRSRGATEAMYLMARHAFEDLGFRRYEWKCNALNARSRRAALRLGFKFEGAFRQHMIIKGHNRDTAWYAMLDKEWPARKAAFERWLSDDNFDESGRQRIPLSSLNSQA
jgi:RimJ/RimL family protein N-acetyltransferase